MDDVAYACAIRAASFSLDWCETMKILDEAFTTLGESSLSVLHTALINFNYGKFCYPVESCKVMGRVTELLLWMENRSLCPCQQTGVRYTNR